MGTILSTGVLQSILGGVVQSATLLNKTSKTNAATSSNASGTAQQPDNSQLSPIAQLISTLQQIQQANPNQYQQVTQQIASNLGSAAQAAHAVGNSTAANQLTELATDFSTASQSGQLPGLQGIFGHHLSAAAGDGSGSSAGSSTNQAVNQLFSRFQTGDSTSGALNPTAIILNTLSTAGIGGSSS